METSKNPYVGPRPFEQYEESLFHGREGEANELFSLICAHPVVLFYSQSGAGKTSLLNARIIPKLKVKRAEVFGVARVGGKLPRGIAENDVANIFVFNALLSLQGEKKQFSTERLSRIPMAEYLKSQDHKERDKYFYPLHILIFDQFEEIFTSFPNHWRKHEDFFLNVSEALQGDSLLRVVFAMREEYVAALDPFAPMLPQRLQKRFRLERLREEAALAAVEGPLKGTGRSFAPGVAKKLVNNLMQVPIKYIGGTMPTTGEYVEPVQLQIVCHSLWESLPKTVEVIDERAVAEFGDVNTALAKYYDKSLQKIAEIYPDVDEGKLRIWFERSLITPIGTRGTVYMDEGRTEDALSERVVVMLEDRRLIRPELRGGAKWYELTHDRFIEPILQSNKEWFASLPADKAFIYELEKRTRRWEQQGRHHQSLLTDEDLREVRLVLQRHANLKVIISDGLREYINVSEAAAEKRKQKALRKRMFFIIFITIAAAALVVSTIYSSFKAAQASSDIRDKRIRRGDQAKEYADLKGKEYAALAFGIEAVGISDVKDVPVEAVQGLRTALTTIGNKVWLRDGTTRPDRLELSVDGKLALTASSSEFVVWDSVTGQKLFGFPEPEDGEWRQLAFSPDGKFLFAVSAPVRRDPDQKQSKVDLGLDEPQGKKTDKRLVLILDARSGQSLEDLQGKLQGARGMQVSDNGKYILSDFPESVKVVDIERNEVRAPFPATQQQWSQIALSSDGSYLVAVYDSTVVEILATDSGQVVGRFSVDVPRVSGSRDFIAFSRDGQRGVLARPLPATNETVALVWDGGGKERMASFRGKVGAVQHVAISPDGNSVVIIGRTGAAIYDISTRHTDERPLPPHADGIDPQYSGTSALVIQNDSKKSTVLAWNTLTGETGILAQADASKYKFTKAAMTPDASTIITASEDGIIQVWAVGDSLKVDELTVEELLKTACKKLRPQAEFAQVSDLCK